MAAHPAAASGRRRTRGARLRLVGVGSAAVVVMVAGGALVCAVLARADLASARTGLVAGQSALLRTDPAVARAAFRSADAALARAERRLGSWEAVPGRLLPVVRQNLDVETAVVRGGRRVAAAGLLGASLVATIPTDGGRLAPQWRGGAVALDPIVRAGRIAARIGAQMGEARRLVASSGTSLLAPSVRRARAAVLETIDDARHRVEVAEAVSFLVPRMLGKDGPRRWLVGAENSGELRGRGGYIGSVGVLEVDAGRLHMGPFVATTDLPPLAPAPAAPLPLEYRRHYVALGALDSWPNLTMSPDFSSAASVLLDRLTASGGPTAGGVIATDPRALSYLLSVTGPVAVEGVAEPISADTVVDWSLNRAYFEFPDEAARKQVLGRIAGAVWGRIAMGGGLDGRRLAEAIGRALVERHAVLYSLDRREQEVIDRVGAGGGLSSDLGDYVLVVGQNMGENKMDYYVQREVNYRGRVRRDGSVDSRLSVVVRNLADPASALPDYVGGARPDIALGAGSVRTYLSVFVPEQAVIHEVRQGGVVTGGFDNRLELGKRLFGTYLEIGPGQAKEVSIRYHVPRALAPGGYRLTLQNQATVRPDEWSVEVDLPGGGGGRALRWEGPLVADRRIGVASHAPSSGGDP